VRRTVPRDAVATITYDKQGYRFEVPGTAERLRFDSRCAVHDEAPKSPAKPVTGEVTPDGGEPRESLQATLRRASKRAVSCYEQGLKAQPDLSGRVVVRLTISPAGAVTEALIEGSTLRAPPVERCIRALLHDVRFAASPKQRVITYPLIFSAR
jgi:hypothetical protein